MRDRRLNWDGCLNARDLGGLRTRDGCKTRWGALVRSDDVSKLSAAGWASLYDHGIRTIIALQTAGIVENNPDAAPRPPDIETVRVDIEDLHDSAFVEQWVDSNLWGTPLYYQDALNRWPGRHAAAIAAIAQARPGGVLFHCHRGNDRTGIIALLLLALAGVEPGLIAADYELSPDPWRDEFLKSQHTSSREVILDTVEGLDVEGYLLAAGLSKPDLGALKERFIEPRKADR